MNKSIATIALIIVLGAGGYFAYAQFFATTVSADDATPDSSSVSPDDAGAKLIALLAKLQAIKMDGSIFNSPQFASLRDETVPVADEPVGRSNPFAPLGTGSSFIASTNVITFAASTTAAKGGSQPATAASSTKKAAR